MWATLGTGCYPMTHGIVDFNLSGKDLEITYAAFASNFLKVQPLWNITAEAGKKTYIKNNILYKLYSLHYHLSNRERRTVIGRIQEKLCTVA